MPDAAPRAGRGFAGLCRALGLKQTRIISWGGPLPEVGDYLRSTRRPRFAYRVAVIDPAPADARYVAKAGLERIAADAVPDDARIHDWYWTSRS